MTHVFVAPHPDDVALSCGGLIASLRELGQNVTILTVFSGNGSDDGLTDYQREALGFGSKALWPATEAFNRSAIEADWPTAALVPSWAADDGPARRDADRRRRSRQALLAALVVVPPGEHPQPSRWPTSRSSTTCRPRARSTPTTSSRPRPPAT